MLPTISTKKYFMYSFILNFVLLILLLLRFPILISGMEEMQAVVYKPGGAEGLSVVYTVPKPTVGEEQILIRIHYFAINRADILQRKGSYPPPKGESDILGLEAAGIIDSIGSNCSKQWRLGCMVWLGSENILRAIAPHLS